MKAVQVVVAPVRNSKETSNNQKLEPWNGMSRFYVRDINRARVLRGRALSKHAGSINAKPTANSNPTSSEHGDKRDDVGEGGDWDALIGVGAWAN